MNWRKLTSFIQAILNFPGCILVFVTCVSATYGILYLQDPFEEVFQYLPAIAGLCYALSRSVFAIENGIKISRNEILGFLLIISTAFSVAMQFYLGIDFNDKNGLSSFDFTLAIWFFNITYFFAGASCTRAEYKKSNLLSIILALSVLLPYLAAPKNFIFIDYYALRVATGMDELSHLSISEFCVFLLIGAFSFASNKLRPIVILVTAVCLFGLQGRSSTIFTTLSLLLFWAVSGGHRVVVFSMFVILIVLGGISFLPLNDLFSNININIDLLERMLLIHSDDDSLTGRKNIFWESIVHLPESVWFGDPTFIAHEAGKMGSYIHNLLSMWQFFGLIPFILAIILLLLSLVSMKQRIIKGGLSVMEEFACILLIYSAISVVFSKSVVFYWIWFTLGYWMLKYDPIASLRGKNKKRRRVKKRRISFPKN